MRGGFARLTGRNRTADDRRTGRRRECRHVPEVRRSSHHDEFAEALDELEGRAEYVVKCRYVEETILAEVLAANPEAAHLREAIRGKSEDAGLDDRIALGEPINNSIAAKREEDTRKVVDALNELGFDVNLRESTHEADAAHVACLAETAKQGELENAMSRLASEWSGRVNVRLLGPLAPYDFSAAVPAMEASYPGCGSN